MAQAETYMTENTDLSPTRAMFRLTLVAAVGILVIASLQAYLAPPPALVLGLALLAAGLAGWASYHLVVAPLARRPAAPAAPPMAGDKPVLATVDPLTHVLNHRGITTSLLEAMAQAQRYNNALSIALVSIDGLDGIKQAHGQAGRDKALELVSSMIGEIVRMPDRVGRNADDQFLIVMPQTKAAAATKVAERVRSAIAKTPLSLDSKTIDIAVSYGVAAFGKGQDLEKFLSNAQQALRAA